VTRLPYPDPSDQRNEPPFLRYEDLAVLLRVPEDTLRTWVRRGLIPFVRLGGKTVRFRSRDINAWLAASTSKVAQP
jgi:excisionase family DNA binding protein